MFTGIVQDVGEIVAWDKAAHGVHLRVATNLDTARMALGDSVAVDGCCLTIVAHEAGVLGFDLSEETLARTRFSALGVGARVNLEPALRAGDPLGGHFVTGHVDGVGRVARLHRLGEHLGMDIAMPEHLMRYMAEKGSVAINGVSLTINALTDRGVRLHLIPHTLARTNLGGLAPGDPVNVEVDLLARYLARLLEARA